MRKSYPSDISRKQFENIHQMLENFRKKTCPRKHDLYDIFCAILYIVKEGCTWRGLPHDYPNWRIVYRYFQLWGQENKDGLSLFEEAMHELVRLQRIENGREAQTSMIIIDSKSVKTTDLAEEKGYDGGKKLPA